MSIHNGNEETKDNDVIMVNDIKQLPYLHIPYASIAHARAKHPTGTIYYYASPHKIGWQIIAYPVMMTKPEKEETDERNVVV